MARMKYYLLLIVLLFVCFSIDISSPYLGQGNYVYAAVGCNGTFSCGTWDRRCSFGNAPCGVVGEKCGPGKLGVCVNECTTNAAASFPCTSNTFTFDQCQTQLCAHMGKCLLSGCDWTPPVVPPPPPIPGVPTLTPVPTDPPPSCGQGFAYCYSGAGAPCCVSSAQAASGSCSCSPRYDCDGVGGTCQYKDSIVDYCTPGDQSQNGKFEVVRDAECGGDARQCHESCSFPNLCVKKPCNTPDVWPVNMCLLNINPDNVKSLNDQDRYDVSVFNLPSACGYQITEDDRNNCARSCGNKWTITQFGSSLDQLSTPESGNWRCKGDISEGRGTTCADSNCTSGGGPYVNDNGYGASTFGKSTGSPTIAPWNWFANKDTTKSLCCTGYMNTSPNPILPYCKNIGKATGRALPRTVRPGQLFEIEITITDADGYPPNMRLHDPHWGDSIIIWEENGNPSSWSRNDELTRDCYEKPNSRDESPVLGKPVYKVSMICKAPSNDINRERKVIFSNKYNVDAEVSFEVRQNVPPVGPIQGLSYQCIDEYRARVTWNTLANADYYMTRLDDWILPLTAEEWEGVPNNCGNNPLDVCINWWPFTTMDLRLNLDHQFIDGGYTFWVHGYNGSGWGTSASISNINCAEKTCFVDPVSVASGGLATIRFGGNANKFAQEPVGLVIQKRDGSQILPAPPGYTSTQYGGRWYYISQTQCTSQNYSSCSLTRQVTLPPGSYDTFCDLTTNPLRCSGNPNCTYKNGSLDCAGWRECSAIDNKAFVIPNPPTPTPTNYPNIVITGAFQQRTGVAPSQLKVRLATATNGLPVNSVSISNFQTDNVSLPGTNVCHTTSCSVSAAATGSRGYSCTLSFPTNCAILIPQTYKINAVIPSSQSTWYSGSTLDVPLNVAPVTSYSIPYPISYANRAWIKFINTDIIRSVATTFTNNISFITDKYSVLNTNPGLGDAADPGSPLLLDGTGAGIVTNSNTIVTTPRGSYSQSGGTIPSYTSAIGASHLQTYVEEIFRSKPFNTYIVGSFVDDQINVSNAPSTSLGSTDAKGIFIARTSATNNALSNISITSNINSNTTKSLIIIGNNITIDPTVTEINAVLIAKNYISIRNPITGASPLKIKGNMIAFGGIINDRVRSDQDHARPTVLMVFSPTVYLDLLKLMSIPYE